MMQTAESWHRCDIGSDRCAFCPFSACWSLLLQPEVRPVVVVVANILVHEPFQMMLIEHDHMVEQVATAVADEALSNAVLPRAFERSANGFHTKDFRSCQDFSAKSGIAVVNQIARRCVERKCLAQLLTHPGAGWMSRHIEIKDSSSIMCDDEEAIENAERECRHGEEVHRGDGLAVVLQEGLPRLRFLWIVRRLAHPAQNRSLGNVEAEHP